MKKNILKSFMIAFAAMFIQTASADIIVHQGDRYIINVEEMELTGEETLMDILLMCPEALTVDGMTQIRGGQSLNPFDNYSVRTDNLDIDIDPELFLNETKAREVSKIKICTHAGIMKGSGGLNKKIDVYFKKGKMGAEGRVNLQANTQGNAATYNTAKYANDNMVVWGTVLGKLGHENARGTETHSNAENVKFGLNWDISDKDNLVMQVSQTYKGEHNRVGDIRDFDRYLNFSMVYVRDLSDNGASFLFQGVMDYATNRNSSFGALNSRNRESNPYILGEFNFPMFSKNFWVTAGIETGLTSYQNVIKDYCDWSNYTDFYAQIDWKIGPVNISLGDRARVLSFWQNEAKVRLPNTDIPLSYNHSKFNHNYTASVYGTFAKNHTLQATFAKRFWNVGFDNFWSEETDAVNNIYIKYLADAQMKEVYTTELKYTYQKKDLVLMAMVNNASHNNVGNHENTLGIGVSAFWHKGIVRLNAGINYYWDRIEYDDMNDHNNFVRIRVQPQVTLPKAWRIIPTIIYNSPITYAKMPKYEGNVVASLAVTKTFAEKWELKGSFNNIADQYYGKRNFSIGATYYW